MGIFFTLLLGSLLLGTLTGFAIVPGVVIYLHDMILCLGIVYFAALYIKDKKFYIPRLWKTIALFCIVGVFSLLFNSGIFPFTALLTGSLYLWRWLAYALLYVLFVQRQIHEKNMLTSLFVFGSIFGAVGLFQFFLYPNLRILWYLGWDPHYYRLFSTVLDPNFAGIILVLTVLLGYYLYVTEKKISYLITLIVLVFCIYLTFSRSSYLAFCTGALVYGSLQRKWKVIGIVLLFIAVIVLVPTPGGKTLRLLREDSTYSRFSNWKESSSLFMTSPIVGHGFNTLRYVQTPKGADTSTFISHAAAGVDSSILFLLVTSGIVGLAAYVHIFYRAGIMKKKTKESIEIHQLYLSSVCALLVHSLFLNSMFYPWVMIWFWILIAASELIYDR